MAINQLFKIKPSKALLKEILQYINIDLDDLDKKKCFSIKDITDNKIDTKFTVIKDKLENYYLPCKKKNYLDKITIKKFITILRQLLKLYNYKLQTYDKYNNGIKYIIYTIISIQNINNKKEINCIISFD